MPTYEYSCLTCGAKFEVFQSMRDAPLKVCTCGKRGRVKRLIGRGAGIIFKGSGFYETDYKRRPARTKAEKAEVSPAKDGAAPAAPAKGGAAAPAKGDSAAPAAGGASAKK